MPPGRGNDTVSFTGHADGAFAQAHVTGFQPGEDHLLLQGWFVGDDGVQFLVGTSGLVPHLDTNGDQVIDGTDPASPYASSFALGEPEHGIGLLVGGDALVVRLPQDVAALAVDDFLL